MSYSILQEELWRILEENAYPLHMPGHKRRLEPADGLPYRQDLTEVEGTDNLHHPEGILKEAMDRTAALYKADRTFYLVNGSTCGILAAVRAAVPFGGTLLAARNCHRSVCHAAELAGARVRWIRPPFLSEYEACGSLRPEDVRRTLARYPEASALILTSPTYEGVVSDIRKIAGICHKAGCLLIVDEAHGAHFGLFTEAGFPQSAVALGADLVVQSPHKTLPSLTQTAWLHVAGDRIDPERVRQQLQIFQSSSPSYPLLVSLDACSCLLAERAPEMGEEWARNLAEFDEEIRDLAHLRVLCHGADKERRPAGIFAFDPGKHQISCRQTGMTGAQLAAMLREEFGLETEKAGPGSVLAMTSPADDPMALYTLQTALISIDRDCVGAAGALPFPDDAPRLRSVLTLREALGQAAETVPAGKAAGRICGEYLYAYPPGIPYAVPGEILTGALMDYLAGMEAAGCKIFHSHAGEDGWRVLEE